MTDMIKAVEAIANYLWREDNPELIEYGLLPCEQPSLEPYRKQAKAAIEAARPYIIAEYCGVIANRLDLALEDIECLNMCLDDLGTPRADGAGNIYSLWGRVSIAIKAAIQKAGK